MRGEERRAMISTLHCIYINLSREKNNNYGIAVIEWIFLANSTFNT
jgi:hypothetical protein